MRDDITRLVKRPPADKRLQAATKPVAIRSQTGLERPPGSQFNINEITVESTDGLFTFTVKVVNE